MVVGVAGRKSKSPRHARWPIVAVALVIAFAAPAGALAAFPGVDPDESPRDNTPQDPDFDDCEIDDAQGGAPCSYFDEEFRAFGFSPDTAQLAPPSPVHPQYADCAVTPPGTTSQLDAQGREANLLASEGQECAQIAGVRADTAFKYFGKYDPAGSNAQVGSDEVTIAILDTGILWQEEDLRKKVHLNAAELPTPQTTGGATCPADDCDNDGAFNVADFANDPRVSASDGDDEADSVLDASDLIERFSRPGQQGDVVGGVDDDGNGYVDDIAGWDFFDDDNDPFDISSCCSASDHGTDRAREAAAETDNTEKGIGMCPDCQIMPLRVWDTFIVPTDFYAMGVDYATRNGASVVEGAVAGLTNTQFARRVFERADQQGLSLMLVSSDINSANHNYPTNYNEAMYVAGSLPDTAPFGACNGPGGLPGIGDFPAKPPPEFTAGCNAFLTQLGTATGCPGPTCVQIVPTGQPPTTSFFRNSNLTQYGGKADIVMMGSTGSVNTGQASGAAGLIHSFGRLWFAGGGAIPPNPGAGGPSRLSGNEVRQLLTMTAEDVQPENTGTIGQADKAEQGWDTHFGYGRVNLANALARISNDPVGPASSPPPGWPCQTSGANADPNCIPPEAQLDAPDWFAPINVDRAPAGGVAIKGRIAAPHSNSGVGTWELEYACGQQPTEAEFLPIPGASGTGSRPAGSTLGTIPMTILQTLAACDESFGNDPENPLGDPGRPAGTLANAWPADPYPSPDPERHAFQVRLTVHEQDDPNNLAQYRKTLFAYNDDGNLPGWPKPVGTGANAGDYVTASGGEASQRLYDVNGDNELDVIQATSSGELWVLNSAGNPIASFNNGQPVTTDEYLLSQAHGVGAGLPTPRETLRTPAIGDIDGDLEAEIVAAAGEHVYAWELDGDPVLNFPVRLDPVLSEPCQAPDPDKPCFVAGSRRITSDNHIKRGIFGSPALADLSGGPALEIVVTALDQHVYAWEGDGDLVTPGFPKRLDTAPASDGAEIVTSPAIAELDGDARPEIVASTNEVVNVDPAAPSDPFGLLNVFIGQARGSNPVYAINHDGTDVPGWPALVGVAAGNLLPLVLPGHDAAVVDIDDDGVDEVSISAGTSLAGQGSQLVDGQGDTISTYANATANTLDNGPILNLADYTSVGNVSGLPGSLWAVKGGLTVNGAANLLAVNQNLPFSHVEQAWEIGAGTPTAPAASPGYPRATDDFQLLSNAGIARVSGSGPGRHILVGTGMYQLHAYDSTGQDAAGWPKFTGGWTQPTPAVGDADGDGDLDVTGYTREGWSFLWNTGTDACDSGTPASSTNQEWWTSRHDERGTGNYGTDSRPPGTPENLQAQRSGSTVTLSFTAPGDDWMCGTADRFRVIGSANPITSPSDGATIDVNADPSGTDEEDPAASGGNEQVQLSDDDLAGAQYVAVFYQDDAGNWGLLASVAVPATGTGPGPDPTPTPTPDPPSPSPGPNPPPAEDGPCSNVVPGTSKPDTLIGSDGSDKISGRGGSDKIKGGAGDDCLRGGRGRDKIRGGEGDDKIHVRGGRGDRVKCGPGDDTVVASSADKVGKSCETVKD